MSDIYAAYCRNGRNGWAPLGAGPRAGIRRGDGNGSWVEITNGLWQHIEGLDVGSGVNWAIMDMWFIQGRLVVAWYDQRNNNSGISALTGTTWRHLVTTVGDATVYTAFFCWNRRPFVCGQLYTSLDSRSRFAIWEIVGSEVKLYMRDDHADIPIQQAWRGCVLMSPTIKDTLVIGDAWEDSFSCADLKAKTFHAGSYPGGSCIFAMGIDNHKLIWTGDYGNYYYGSWDGGLTFERTGRGGAADPAFPDDGQGLPELWEMKRWKDNLYGVGCNPCALVRRTDVVDHTHSHFEVVKTYDEFARQDGVGFLSFQPQGADLVVGFGGEPYYYDRIPGAGAAATVFRIKPDLSLVNVGGGLDWGSGVHQVCDNTRSCGFGALTGAHVDGGGVHMDPIADRSNRGFASR